MTDAVQQAINPGLETLCRLLSPCLSTEQVIRSLPSRRPEWEAAVAVANDQFLTPALYAAAKHRGFLDVLDPALADYLETVHAHNLARNQGILEQLAELTGLLAGIGATPVLLKGAAALADDLYGDPGARFMHDIDLLLPEGSADAAFERMLECGYRQRDPGEHDRYAQHLPRLFHPRHAVGVELHTRPLSWDAPCAALDTTRVFAAAAELPAAARNMGIEGFLMAPRHRLLHNVLHTQVQDYNHLKERLSLKQLLEFARLLQRDGGDLDWRLFREDVAQEGYTQVLQRYVLMSRHLFGTRDQLGAIEIQVWRGARATIANTGKPLSRIRVAAVLRTRLRRVLSPTGIRARFGASNAAEVTLFGLRHVLYLLTTYTRPANLKRLYRDYSGRRNRREP